MSARNIGIVVVLLGAILAALVVPTFPGKAGVVVLLAGFVTIS